MKIFSTLTIALLMIFQTVGFAATGTFSASGEYLMSDYDTPEIAEEIALDFAKQNAAEQAGIYLENYSRSIDSEVEEDEVKTVASSKVEVLTKNITRKNQSDGRILLRADIKAKVDTAELDNFLAKKREQRQRLIQQYKELQAMNEKIKQDIDALQAKLVAIKEEVKDDDFQVEQERINREFLSKQKLEDYGKEFLIFDSDTDMDVHGFANKVLSDKEKITAIVNESIKFNPKNYMAYSMRVLSSLSEDPAKKIQNLNQAIILAPNESRLYEMRGNIYRKRLENFSRAMEDYSQALKLDPKNIFVFKDRADFYREQKDYSHAIEDYTQIINIAPKDDSAYIYRGDCYRELKNYPAALKDYDKAISIPPKHIFLEHRNLAYLARSMVYVEQGNFEQALADCDKAIEFATETEKKATGFAKDFAKKNVEIGMKMRGAVAQVFYLKRSVDYMEKGDFRSAVVELDKLIKINPGYQAYFARGVAYENLGEYDKALADYNKALELDPNNELAKNNRQRVLAKMKK